MTSTLKRVVFFSAILLAAAFSLNLFTGDTQSRKGPASKNTPKDPKKKNTPKGPKKGIDYKVFDHNDPAHKFACITCHDNVEDGQRVVNFPNSHNINIEPACDNCHARVPFTIHQNGAMCLICHLRPKNSKSGVSKDLIDFPDQRDDQFGIKFPHVKHSGLDAKSFRKTNIDIDILLQLNGKQPNLQKIAKEVKCIECHVKDGKKEADYSTPHHPECERCHGTIISAKGLLTATLPGMQSCEECHELKAPQRNRITNTFANFFHDSSHEYDSRPNKDPKDKKNLTKDGKNLKCQFCHEVDASIKLSDISQPLQSRCIVCHNAKKDPARPLTPDELGKLKADPK